MKIEDIMFWRLIGVTLLLAICASFVPNDKVYWHDDSRLSWSDFRGRPVHSSPHGAMSSVGVDLNYVQRGDQVSISIQAFFIRRSSWVKADTKTDEALNHEQGHFDIAEIYARKLRKEVGEMGGRGTTLVKRAHRAHEAITRALHACQEKYDTETKHHLDRSQQQIWNDWIAQQLQSLAPYSAP